jgi:hypothetical protein
MDDPLEVFIRHECLMPGNWCNGHMIPIQGRKHIHYKATREREPCRYYTGKSCTHPKHPKGGKYDRTKAQRIQK